MPTAIVLGGGGTLGDFQVGALKYLYKKGVLPHINCVCGTSIGAINAAIIATGDGCVARLEKYWEEDVNSRVDLIPQHEWSDTLGPLLEAVFSGAVGSWVYAIGRLAYDSEHAFSDVRSAIKDMEEMFTLARKQRALYSAELLERKMYDDQQDLEKALKSDIALRIYAIDLKTGAYTCFHNKACRIDPAKRKKGSKEYILCDSRDKLVKAARASSAIPGIFSPAEVDCNWYIDGSAREVVPVAGAVECEADEIYAILCLPRLTPGEDSVVDYATEDWSTSSVFDIRTEDFSTNCMDWSSKGDRDLIDIANRTAAIVLDELTAGDLEAAKHSDKPIKCLKVIDPLVPVHGFAQLNIGLLRINIDQGHMRAFDELDAPKAERKRCKQLTKEITSRRVAIWRDEHKLIEQWAQATKQWPLKGLYPLHILYLPRMLCGWGDVGAVDTTILYKIRRQKKELKRLVEERQKLVGTTSLPENYKDIYRSWEPHDLHHEMEDIPLPRTPWDRLDLGRLGTEVIPERKLP